MVPLHDEEAARAVVILSVLVIVSLALFASVTRDDTLGSTLFTVLFLSFALKLLAAYFRFEVGLLADAFAYDKAGADIAEMLSRGLWPDARRVWGTEFLRLTVGIVYFVTGRTLYGITILWAWLALLGMLFFYMAFTTAFPDGNRRLYLLLIFLYPSMLLWTSSLGKDALVVFCLGMTTYGVTRVLRRLDMVGVFWFGVGMAGVLMIRPHIAAVFAASFAAAMLVRPIQAGMMTPVIRVAGAVLVIVVAAGVIQTASGFVGIDDLSSEEVLGFIDVRRERTMQGGSSFEQSNPRNPVSLLVFVPTVLLRPFPWETRSVFALLSAIEGTLLLLLIIFRRRSIRAAVSDTFRNAFLPLVFTYIVIFAFFFSAIGNFGIIARQRVQVLPFVFVLISYLGTPHSNKGVQR